MERKQLMVVAQIGFLLLLVSQGPFLVVQYAEASGMEGPVALIPGAIAFCTGFVPLVIVLNKKMAQRERRAR